MAESNPEKKPTKAPMYKTCQKHTIIYVHECPYCANKKASK